MSTSLWWFVNQTPPQGPAPENGDKMAWALMSCMIEIVTGQTSVQLLLIVWLSSSQVWCRHWTPRTQLILVGANHQHWSSWNGQKRLSCHCEPKNSHAAFHHDIHWSCQVWVAPQQWTEWVLARFKQFKPCKRPVQGIYYTHTVDVKLAFRLESSCTDSWSHCSSTCCILLLLILFFAFIRLHRWWTLEAAFKSPLPSDPGPHCM